MIAAIAADDNADTVHLIRLTVQLGSFHSGPYPGASSPPRRTKQDEHAAMPMPVVQAIGGNDRER